MKISKNTVVSLNYTLKNSEGQIIDSTEGREPLIYLHGVGGMIPGLETGLEGSETGTEKEIVVAPEDAFGSRREDLMHIVPLSGFQGDSEEELEIGMKVQLNTDQGTTIATVAGIEGDEVTLDLNHPLADVELHFTVKVLDVREASQEEIAHGHVHGPGGHHH